MLGTKTTARTTPRARRRRASEPLVLWRGGFGISDSAMRGRHDEPFRAILFSFSLNLFASIAHASEHQEGFCSQAIEIVRESLYESGSSDKYQESNHIFFRICVV